MLPFAGWIHEVLIASGNARRINPRITQPGYRAIGYLAAFAIDSALMIWSYLDGGVNQVPLSRQSTHRQAPSLRRSNSITQIYPCESSFDESLVESSFYFNPNTPLDIAKWSETVTGPAISGQDLFFSCSQDLQDMGGSDAFELKNDNASVYSMADSAYQSQTGASRRGTSMAEAFQTLTPQDRSRVSSQYLGSDIYSPTLSSDTFSAFPEPSTDMSQMHLPSAVGESEMGEPGFSYTNYSTGQSYTQYASTSTPRFTPSTDMNINLNWGTADARNFSTTFNFTSPKSSHGIDGALFSNQDPTELMFNNSTVPFQRHMRRLQVDTSAARPSALRSSSSFTSSYQESRRASTNDPSFGTFVMSPTSAVNVPQHLIFDQSDLSECKPAGTTAEKEETPPASLAAQSTNEDDEPLSPSEAEAAQTMEDEQGKVARSHHLYHAQPDGNGEYHCPNEGKQGCNHKPTKLKCNYDKYVDSHLRPFRCRNGACVGVQFSSTACLLRHEREAHGMHGHGSKPHLCKFADCERSVQGNGFPRRYNLFDHMKRVHDWTGPAEQSPPVQPGQLGAKRQSTSRKRKLTAEEASERRHKVAKPTPQQLAQQRRGQLQEDFQRKKESIIQILKNLTGPNDLRDDIQLSKEVIILHDISSKYKNIG
ncbi:hypothetical protein K469DRAFT_691617 [Zopfia rhizophila CBS 207.26]|uniref:C2H2-type domain-containing protein n=1 Tax=Zopfia rhizophila CBS 207.26 TaxID=1314779 RepID=A0A6A6DV04_9PEZI|nr:hypothetical protein K469DRAFT_691617 [Zopfia rhizophila CBS 207.26]